MDLHDQRILITGGTAPGHRARAGAQAQRQELRRGGQPRRSQAHAGGRQRSSPRDRPARRHLRGGGATPRSPRSSSASAFDILVNSAGILEPGPARRRCGGRNCRDRCGGRPGRLDADDPPRASLSRAFPGWGGRLPLICARPDRRFLGWRRMLRRRQASTRSPARCGPSLPGRSGCLMSSRPSWTQRSQPASLGRSCRRKRWPPTSSMVFGENTSRSGSVESCAGVDGETVAGCRGSDRRPRAESVGCRFADGSRVMISE